MRPLRASHIVLIMKGSQRADPKLHLVSCIPKQPVDRWIRSDITDFRRSDVAVQGQREGFFRRLAQNDHSGGRTCSANGSERSCVERMSGRRSPFREKAPDFIPNGGEGKHSTG